MKRKRSKVISLEAEIRAKAKQIMDDQMAEAMKAAALMIVGRKLDEIRSLLQAAGFTQVPTQAAGVAGPVYFNPRVVQNSPPTVEHPCFQCGRESTRRGPRSKWDPQGRWACKAHEPLLGIQEQEDAVDRALLGPQEGPTQKKPVVVTNAPAKMVAEPQEAQPQEAAGSASLEDAFSALGVQ